MYRWSALRASHWRLLRLRARRMAELYDLFRVDHVVGLFRTFGFRGEEPCGFDPAEEADQRAQGREILEIMLAEAAPAGVVAEDLGTIPKFVPETLSGLDVPGYQVLRWQRVDERVVDPLEYPECSIATTGTHDTDTLVEWWESLALEERAEYAEAVGCAVDAPEPVRRLAILERLYRSPSRYVVPPVQDLFGWRERINTPATVGEGNWRYRLPLTIDGLSRDPAMQRDCDKLVRLIDGSGRLRKMDPSHRDGRSARPTAARPGELAMDDFKTGSVRANGLDFHYLEAGEGPLVLCLHGFPDHARSFRFQLPALAAAGFRAVAPYMRGYAPTDVPDGPYQSAALAKDAVSLIDALSPKVPAFVFGHDWGAIAAYGAAIVAPNRVKKIATAAVPHGPQLMEAILTSYAQMRRSFYIFMFQLPTAERSVSHNNFEFLDRLWADWSPGWTLPSAEMAALKATFQKPGVLSAALAYYRATFNPALQWPELAELQGRMMMEPIQVPGLVFHGQKDGCIGVETLEGMETVFPKGLAKMVIPDAGHFLHQEKPEAVNEPLLAFLKS
jgi:pimeloyl-ACP methyl ester carboxylesterase